jgi:membrane-associated protein
MNWYTFLLYNVLGAVLWAGGVTSLGYFLGSEIPGVEDYLTYIILGIIFVSSIPVMIETYRAQRDRQ